MKQYFADLIDAFLGVLYCGSQIVIILAFFAGLVYLGWLFTR